MRFFLTGIFLLIALITFSQTVDELEHELSFYKSGETWGQKKEVAYKLQKMDGLNTNAINYLVEVYSINNQKDSIGLLFDRLIKENPKSPKPYLLRVREQNAHFAGLTYTQQINFLKEAYKLDSVNIEAIYALGKLYYELFIQEFDKNNEKANLDYYSTNAIQYFSILCKQNESYKESLMYPLLQLANYLGDTNRKILYENYNVQSSYFPLTAFVDLPNDWETNYSANVLECVSKSEFKISGVESAIFHINWYAKHLKALEEPVLRDSLPSKVFRFTWLRSFHNPIVIGLENNNDSIILYWKVGNGAGGYEPGKLIEDKNKKLTTKVWSNVVSNINSIDFWNLPSTKNGITGMDGAQWILEGKELGKYHVVDRWSGGEIEELCMLLLRLTDLKIEEGDIY
jgi:hypothetical protein